MAGDQSCPHSTQHWARPCSGGLCSVLRTGRFLQIVSHEPFSFLAGKTTGIPIHVFGTETHMTAIVGMALGHRPIPNQPPTAAHTANFLLNASGSTSVGASFPPTLKEGPILPPPPLSYTGHSVPLLAFREIRGYWTSGIWLSFSQGRIMEGLKVFKSNPSSNSDCPCREWDFNWCPTYLEPQFAHL